MHMQDIAHHRARDLTAGLYRAVDAKSIPELSAFLSDDVVFQLGNHDPIRGKDAVLAANASFFTSIATMTHSIENVWAQSPNVICAGYVQYRRHDGSELSLPFSTILALEKGLIVDYQVYVDISPL